MDRTCALSLVGTRYFFVLPLVGTVLAPFARSITFLFATGLILLIFLYSHFSLPLTPESFIALRPLSLRVPHFGHSQFPSRTKASFIWSAPFLHPVHALITLSRSSSQKKWGAFFPDFRVHPSPLVPSPSFLFIGRPSPLRYFRLNVLSCRFFFF